MSRLRPLVNLIFLLGFVAVCTGVFLFRDVFEPGTKSLPVPEASVESAHIRGLPNIRRLANVAPDIDFGRRSCKLQPVVGGNPLRVLALSGGGSNGAFAAGLLVEWSNLGTRPLFHVVTGVSAGALAAPFAFLGRQYDSELKDLFTQISKDEIVTMRPRVVALFSDSMADPEPLKALIRRHINLELMKAIAIEHRKGRRLFIGTTYVAASRLMIWDIGTIAASGAPQALELIQKIFLASASMPIMFPPVFFDVEVDGNTQRFTEMHVDGGVVRQVFIAPPEFNWDSTASTLGTDCGVEFYVIRNGRARPEYMVMPDALLPLGEHAMHLLALSQGVGDLYVIYVRAQSEHALYRAAWIDEGFNAPWVGWYDPAYNKALFAHGVHQMASGQAWHALPPGLK